MPLYHARKDATPNLVPMHNEHQYNSFKILQKRDPPLFDGANSFSLSRLEDTLFCILCTFSFDLISKIVRRDICIRLFKNIIKRKEYHCQFFIYSPIVKTNHRKILFHSDQRITVSIFTISLIITPPVRQKHSFEVKSRRSLWLVFRPPA